jgi:hypothetical protein
MAYLPTKLEQRTNHLVLATEETLQHGLSKH